MPVQLECQECGKSFKVPPVRKDTAKYCSNACAYLHRQDTRKVPRSVLRCKYCGKRFEEHQCHAGRRVYCSHECRYADPEYGIGISKRTTGEGNAMWSGGVVKHADGYLYGSEENHPFTTTKYVLQHRLVMERHLRTRCPESEYLVEINGTLYLSPDYVVHHKNSIRDDNRIENLLVMSSSEHTRMHNNLNNPNPKHRPLSADKRRNNQGEIS